MNSASSAVSGNRPAAGASTSIAQNLLNLLVAPGEVFDEIIFAPPKLMNWLVPTMLVCLAGAATHFQGAAQTKEMLNYWNPFWIARVVIDLSGPLQSRNIVGKYLQCPAKGSERLFFLPFTGVGYALHGPQLAITGKFLERYLKEVECSVKLLRTQCGGYRLDGVCSCLRPHGGEKQNRT